MASAISDYAVYSMCVCTCMRLCVGGHCNTKSDEARGHRSDHQTYKQKKEQQLVVLLVNQINMNHLNI